MTQAKFSLEDAQLQFLEKYREFGFRDKSAMVRAALGRLHFELEKGDLERSADLYSKLYLDDQESQAWVEDAAVKWPE